MNRLSQYIDELKELAEEDVGSSSWAQNLIGTIKTIDKDSPGIIIVAHAVLTKAVIDEEARKVAEAERRRIEGLAEEERIRRDAESHVQRKKAKAKAACRGPLTWGITLMAVFLAWQVLIPVASGSSAEEINTILIIGLFGLPIPVALITRRIGLTLFVVPWNLLSSMPFIHNAILYELFSQGAGTVMIEAWVLAIGVSCSFLAAGALCYSNALRD